MIFGIGTDIVHIPRIQQALERHGERFAERILTPSELEGYRRAGQPAHFLAKRFAAKEAAAKALGVGFRLGLSLQHIAVRRAPHSRPELHFSGRAAQVCSEQSITAAHLSLADEQEYAVAYVILESDPAPT